jgi:hypothetical protein
VSPVRDARWQAVAALTVTELAGGDCLSAERRARRMLRIARDAEGGSGPRRSAALAGLSVLLWRPPHLVRRDAMPWLELIAPYRAEIAADHRLGEAMMLTGLALSFAMGPDSPEIRRWAGIAGPDMAARVAGITAPPPPDGDMPTQAPCTRPQRRAWRSRATRSN